MMQFEWDGRTRSQTRALTLLKIIMARKVIEVDSDLQKLMEDSTTKLASIDQAFQKIRFGRMQCNWVWKKRLHREKTDKQLAEILALLLGDSKLKSSQPSPYDLSVS